MQDINQLFKDTYPAVLNYVMTLTKDTCDAEDITQKTFLKIYQRIGQYDSSRPFVNWAVTIAKHTFIDHVRESIKYASALERYSFTFDTSRPHGYELEEAPSNMAYKDIILWSMRYMSNLKMKDIAVITQIPENTVMWRINYMKTKYE